MYELLKVKWGQMGPGPFGVCLFIARFDAFHHFPHFNGVGTYYSQTAALKSTGAGETPPCLGQGVASSRARRHRVSPDTATAVRRRRIVRTAIPRHTQTSSAYSVHQPKLTTGKYRVPSNQPDLESRPIPLTSPICRTHPSSAGTAKFIKPICIPHIDSAPFQSAI